VLFSTASDEIGQSAQGELNKLADAILELEGQIPPEINWVIRVDGHTDVRPVQTTSRFQSNWELSAARAIAVVRYLISRGIEPEHLVAAGFGEFQPLDPEDTEEAFQRNRRIELKLTER
jgi:chemotaxis protein MotB